MHYKIGSRGSKLALTQTEYVCNKLRENYPEHTFEIVIVKTEGDRVQNRPLNQIGGKGLFVKEIEERILSGELHMGVHSMKDMPTETVPGLTFTKAWTREDARDVLILREKRQLSELPKGAVIGTGSKRRAYQLRRLRPDIQVADIRGNVETRLRKMEEQKLDGLVLAAAGLHRLGMEERITEYLDEMIPAPAQGVLAIEVREDQKELIRMLNAFADERTLREAQAERAFLQRMGGGCHMPVGARCTAGSGGSLLRMDVMFGNEAGTRIAYASVEGTDPERLAYEAERQIRVQIAGFVSLVGAGPGDPGLITVKGIRAIQRADCIIYDRLAAPELLNDVKPGCELIYAGKANHHHTLRQHEINSLLAEKAMEYEYVVRLKGGDVFVFGRGGEEALYLKERGISFEIIPGISSSIAGPAAAGIPVTNRGYASGFHVVTAHNRRDELAKIDFEAMARSDDTNIFLMGLSKLEEIAERLMEAGMPKETEAAVISHATTSQQRTCVSSLNNIAEDVRSAGLTSPALIVVGKTVSLREKLGAQIEELSVSCGLDAPLCLEGKGGNDDCKSREAIVPKIGSDTLALTKLLRKKGVEVQEIQVGEIRLRDIEIQKSDLREVTWLIFTSRNGIAGFFGSLFASGMDVRDLSGIRIAAVGKKSADCLLEYGVRADFLPEHANEESLIAGLKGKLLAEDVIWHPTGDTGSGRIQSELEDICECWSICVYENITAEAKPVDADETAGVFFTCASSAERFIGLLEPEITERWKEKGTAYSIGPKTSAKLKELGVRTIREAKEASYRALADLV